MRVLRRAKARRETLSEACRHYLKTGDYSGAVVDLTGYAAYQLAGRVLRRVTQGGAPPDEWLDYGDEITTEYSAEWPGHRPFAWWAFEAPAPRECGGLAAPADGWVWRLHFGSPIEWPRVAPGTVLWLESEPSYLHRVGLLLAAERQRLDVAVYDPERIEITED